MKTIEEIPKLMNVLNLYGIGDLRFEKKETYKLTKDNVLVKIKYCGICSSDIERVFINGTYNFPTIPGHEMSGQIVAVNDEDEELLGKKTSIFPLMPCFKCDACQKQEFAQCATYNYFGSRCDGGYSEYLLVPKWNLVLFNDKLDYKIAALCEPGAVAIHSVNIGNIQEDENIAISGTGTIGMMIALIVKSRNANVTVIGRSDESLEFSKKLGFNILLTSELKNKTFDKVFEVVGNNESINQTIDLTDNFGTVILVGNPKDDVLLDKQIYWKILRKQLILKGIWNSSYSSKVNDWKEILNLMTEGDIPFESLISKEFSMQDYNKAFDYLRNSNEKKLKVMFKNE
ncbi:galactitol-1-phosphate 5-dehydrogenase [uncultured Methanobrevibacter sp.]|uniref:galactitol-1-phosphate 5-dehydrogenase n=1 Tax=uncultured Methanobrevibacter sp. TaxID=253161 RepID=UPI00263497AA|nr:galactitol-1-phosphate 5-dehydrogenase [uncultured Methanobrevibacter sp.]